MALSPTSSHGGGTTLGNVTTVTGTPSVGQVVTATSNTAADWEWASQVLLSTTTLAAPGNFDVTGISQAFNDLVAVLICKASAAAASDTICLRFNGDGGTNYYSEMGRFNGASASGVEALAANQAQINPTCPAGTAPFTNAFGIHVVEILGYTSTTWLKSYTGTIHGSPNTTTSNQVPAVVGGTWNSTAAITRIQFFGAGSATLATGSVLRIYGRL